MGAMQIDLKQKVSAPSPSEAFRMMLGTSGGSAGIVKLALDELTPYPNQPFYPYAPDELAELAEDIREHGVLSPVIVRPIDGQYQILSGHNRVEACRLIDQLTVPCIVKDVDDDEAKLILVNTNLNQRKGLKPSEKAFAYKLRLDSLTRQGKRGDLLHNVQKVDNIAFLSQSAQESKRNISYYIRLTFLVPELLQMVDSSKLPMRAGVELSYLSADTQNKLLEYLSVHPMKIDLKKAACLRNNSDACELTRADIERLLENGTAKTKNHIQFTMREVQGYFPDSTPKQMQREILDILRQHFGR